MNDLALFMKSWLKSPAVTGAILPSGTALAGAITAEISAADGQVLELGCGTGAFTRVLVQRGVNTENLTLIESNPHFASRLQANFATARVLCMDAIDLESVDLYPEERRAGAVVCGLPLLSMPRASVAATLRGAFRQLRSDGGLYLFTYGPRCPVPGRMLAACGLSAGRLCTVFANVPPANVYKLVRARQLVGVRAAS